MIAAIGHISGAHFNPAVSVAFALARYFPWRDAEHGGPYEFDQTICPEFIARPELIQIGRDLAPLDADSATR